MFEKLLRARLSPQRYQHSLGVRQTALELARRYGADEKVCALAGLLHDVTKDEPESAQLALLQKYGVPVTDALRRSPSVLHAFTGAEFLRRELGIDDERVLSAVRWHTTGRRGMSLCEKILYVADLIEPNRAYPDVQRLRALAQRDLDAVAFEGVRFVILKNVEKNKFIYPDTFDFYNECAEKRGLL